MADMAPTKSFMGSKGMKRVRDSRDAMHTDDPNRLGKRYRTEAKRLKTIIGGHKSPRVHKTQTPIPGDDLGGGE